MEDSLQNLIQTLQVSGYAIRTHEHTSNMSSIDQQRHQSTPGPNSYRLPGRYSCLLKHTTGTFFFYFYLILTLVVALQPCRSSS